MSATGLMPMVSIAVVIVALAAVRHPERGVARRVREELAPVPTDRIGAHGARRRHPGPSRWARRRREAAVSAALAELCDVLGAAVRAGLNLTLALEVAEDLGPPVFVGALRSIRERVERGERLVVALDRLPSMLGDSIRPITGLLQSADRDGIALARLVDALAADARRERRQHIERNARRLPVLLLGPLVGCVLPAFMILTVVPVVIASVLSLAA